MVDVWAAGVIMYILLCGYAPFGGNSDQTILAKVRKGQFSTAGHEWNSISADAKMCLKRMLVVDPSKRISAAELMEVPWFRHADRLSNQVHPDLLTTTAHLACFDNIAVHSYSANCRHF